jgi:hypothetical protein
MRKMITLMVIGIFLAIGFSTIAMAEPDDPIIPNQAPKTPEIIKEKSGLEKKEYQCVFYSVDPEGDDVYYEISWKKVDELNFQTCSRDDNNKPWLGPYSSGEEINIISNCDESGVYEFTVRAKDVYDKVGPSTTVTVKYSNARIIQLPLLTRVLARMSWLTFILAKVFKI